MSRWTRYSVRFASVLLLVAALQDDERADACGGDFYTINDLTTFDPLVNDHISAWTSGELVFLAM